MSIMSIPAYVVEIKPSSNYYKTGEKEVMVSMPIIDPKTGRPKMRYVTIGSREFSDLVISGKIRFSRNIPNGSSEKLRYHQPSAVLEISREISGETDIETNTIPINTGLEFDFQSKVLFKCTTISGSTYTNEVYTPMPHVVTGLIRVGNQIRVGVFGIVDPGYAGQPQRYEHKYILLDTFKNEFKKGNIIPRNIQF